MASYAYTFQNGDVVTPTKLNDARTVSNIQTADIADFQITDAKLADANVTTAKIADANVTTAKIADANVTTAKITDNAVTNAKFAGSVGLNAWQTRTANYTAVAGDRINADTGGGAFTITLPATPANYTEVTIADHDGDWKTNNLTVARNSSNINGGAADLTCDVSGKQILLRYEGATTGWRIYT
jgi:hypothetical protein